MHLAPTPDSGDFDEDLAVQRAQAGDPAAFGPLIDAHLPAVRAFVALRLPVAHLVDEIAHESFVFAFQHLAAFEAGSSFRAWLRAIAANLVRKEILRYSRSEVNLSRYAQAQSAELAAQPHDHREAGRLELCLTQIPPAMRRLLDAKYAEGRSSEEIAVVFGRNVTWVRVSLFRLRQQLRRCIESQVEVSHAG